MEQNKVMLRVISEKYYLTLILIHKQFFWLFLRYFLKMLRLNPECLYNVTNVI